MTKIDIFSGFLGAGKTTLIKKLISEAFKGEKLVLIENEFGEIGIDGGFLKEAGIEITEMNSGCICCSLVGDFGEALKKVLAQYHPDRIIIEPSGVGKLSDVIKAVKDIDSQEILLNSFCAVVDAKKCKVYMKNFGEFFNNQIENAGTIVLSHTKGLSQEKLQESLHLIQEKNEKANIISTDWEEITGEQILSTIERKTSLEDELKKMVEESNVCPECGHYHEHHHKHNEHCCEHDHEHHHHHHHHEEECHHHEHDEHCCCGHDHEHHHQHHDEECHHEHHHEHEEHCCCGHEHHHHHHADEVFSSWGVETTAKYTKEGIEAILKALENESEYGIILRAKGIVAGDKEWIHFDYVPGEPDIRVGGADVIGRLCVIGSKIDEQKIAKLFESYEVH